MRPYFLPFLGAALVACVTSDARERAEVSNAHKDDRAGVLLELTDERPWRLFFECEEAGGCDVELGASLRSPAPCELFEERDCRPGRTDSLRKHIATVEVEAPAGDLHEARVVVARDEGGEFRTVVEAGAFSGQTSGVYFLEVARALDVDRDLEIVLEARWHERVHEREVPLHVTWAVEGLDDVLGDGCAAVPGASAVEIVAERAADGERFRDIFDCGAGAGVTAPLPVGEYDVWASTTDVDLRPIAASPVHDVVLDGEAELVVLHDLRFLSAQFEALWGFTDERTNDPATCGEVGAGAVVVTAAKTGGTTYDEIFDCPGRDAVGEVVTAPLPLGDYTIVASFLREGAGEAVEMGEPVEEILDEHATVVDAGAFEYVARDEP